MNVVIDTNVIISGLIKPDSIPAQIWNLVVNEKIILLYDIRILNEYENVISRKKFKFPKEIIDPVIDFIKHEGIYIAANPINDSFLDESDKKFLEVTISGEAEYLITGNIKHYPEKEYILTPRDFLSKNIN